MISKHFNEKNNQNYIVMTEPIGVLGEFTVLLKSAYFEKSDKPITGIEIGRRFYPINSSEPHFLDVSTEIIFHNGVMYFQNWLGSIHHPNKLTPDLKEFISDVKSSYYENIPRKIEKEVGTGIVLPSRDEVLNLVEDFFGKKMVSAYGNYA